MPNNLFPRTPQGYGDALIYIINNCPEGRVLDDDMYNMLASLSDQIIGLNSIGNIGEIEFWMQLLTNYIYENNPNVQRVQNYINNIWSSASEPIDDHIVVQILTDTIVDQGNDIYTKSHFDFNKIHDEGLPLVLDPFVSQKEFTIGDLPDSYSIFVNSFISFLGDI